MVRAVKVVDGETVVARMNDRKDWEKDVGDVGGETSVSSEPVLLCGAGLAEKEKGDIQEVEEGESGKPANLEEITDREIRMGWIRVEGGVIERDRSEGWDLVGKSGRKSLACAVTPNYGEILSFGKAQGFPTTRRPVRRELSAAPDDEIEE